MIKLSDILTPDRIQQGELIQSKKRALEQISHMIVTAATDQVDAVQIFEGLVARERLGSTGIGQGVAIPHCRIKALPTVVSALMILPSGIEFDAIDNQPVDIIMALLVPDETTDEHLQLLATLADKFSQPEFREQLRQTHNSKQLYQLIVEHGSHQTLSSAVES